MNGPFIIVTRFDLASLAALETSLAANSTATELAQKWYIGRQRHTDILGQ